MARLSHMVCILCTILPVFVQSLDNGMALTPPMGWLSWAQFYCQTNCVRFPLSCISERLYMDMATEMVEGGYKDAGYQYVNIDDCWSEKSGRDAAGKLVANKTRFPSGIKKMADFMHSQGLKLGIYGDLGTKTCGGYPGTLGYISTDAQTFAEWGVDSLKLDGCNINTELMPAGYLNMTKALNETGRHILYSNEWPLYFKIHHEDIPYEAIAKSCNLWRNYDDINASWKSIQGIINYYDQHQDAMAAINGPGQWNDPDMIVVGQDSITVDQAKAQFAIWCIWSAPLLMSNDLRFIAPPYKQILLNKKVIAVDQDPLGIMGKLTVNTTNVGVYVKRMTPVRNGQHSYAVVFFNRNIAKRASVTTFLHELGLLNPTGYFVEDLYTDMKYGLMKPEDKFKCVVNPTGVVMIKATISDA